MPLSPVPAPTPLEAVPDGGGEEDPLLALSQLAARREECFRDLSVLCLDDVDAVDSAAYDDDRAALDAVLADGAVPRRLEVAAAVIVERLGDSVLISLGADSDPASVLLVKDEAGWRIRDYLEAAAG